MSFAAGWFKGDSLADIEFAVGEALANSVEHGYSPSSLVEICCTCDGVRLTIEIKDNGVGFAPTCLGERPDTFAPRGYGTSIMHALMDAVEYTEGGTRIRLVKTLDVSFAAENSAALVRVRRPVKNPPR
jgi:anti-sigma regulatory factor (Ser/Thr protein kinase)